MRAARKLKERHKKFGVSLSNLDPVRLGEASEAYKLLDAHQSSLVGELTPLSTCSLARPPNIITQLHNQSVLGSSGTDSGLGQIDWHPLMEQAAQYAQTAYNHLFIRLCLEPHEAEAILKCFPSQST